MTPLWPKKSTFPAIPNQDVTSAAKGVNPLREVLRIVLFTPCADHAGLSGGKLLNHIRNRFARLALAGLACGLVATGVHAQDRGPRVLPPAAIDWAAVGRNYNPDVAGKALSAPGFREKTRALDSTTLPVLLPDGSAPVSTSGLIFSSFGDVYDITLPQPAANLGVTLSGTRVSVALDPGSLYRRKPDKVTIGGQPQAVYILQTEEGWLASFNRYGVDYTVTVGCGDDAQSRPYCANDSYIRQVTSSLSEVVLGAQAARAFTAAGGNKRRTEPPARVNAGALKAGGAKLKEAAATAAKRAAAGSTKP